MIGILKGGLICGLTCGLICSLILLCLPLNGIAQGTFELLYLDKDFGKILEKSSDLNSAESSLWQARALRMTGRPAEAIGVAKDALARFPENADIEQLLAELYYEQGRFADARPLLEKYAGSRVFFDMLIGVMEFSAEHAEVVKLLSEKLGPDSTDLQYLVGLSDNYLEMDSLDRAAGVLERVVALNPADQRSLAKLANTYLKKEAYSRAVMICNRALEIDSTVRTIQRIKGFASFRNSDFNTAMSCFSYLLARGDSGKVVLKHLGISEIKEHAFHDARKHLLQVYRLDSADHEVCFFLGRAYLNSTRPEMGLYFLEKSESLLEPDPEILAAIQVEKVSILATLHRYEASLEAYKTAYALAPRPEYLYYMASLNDYRLGNRQAAVELYRKFLESLPDTKEAQKQTLKQQREVSMKKVAEDRLEVLREEQFFNDEIND